MRVETDSDGALRLNDRMPLLRWGSLAGAVLLGATLAWAQRSGTLDARTALGGGIGLALALLAAAFIPDRDFEFNRATGRMTWSVRRMAYRRSGWMPLAEIASVLVQVDVDTDGRTRRLTYRLVLTTAAGPLPLSSIRTPDRDACERLAAQIRGILGHVQPRPPEATIADLAKAGYLVDAVALVRRERGMGLAEAREYVASLAGARQTEADSAPRDQ